MYILFNYLCYNRQHNKHFGDIFNKDDMLVYVLLV
jgi:hypothetical protein